jgi:hypothetical protein
MNATVYVLTDYDNGLKGVYSTKELAERARDSAAHYPQLVARLDTIIYRIELDAAPTDAREVVA